MAWKKSSYEPAWQIESPIKTYIWKIYLKYFMIYTA
jgi:hypothetical protein